MPRREEFCNQVVVIEFPVENTIPIAMAGVEGRDRGINGETKIKDKIPEQNKFRFSLNNLNLKVVDSGRESQVRRSSWLGKGLTVEVNEFGKRRVSWQLGPILPKMLLKEWSLGLQKPMYLGWVILRVAQANYRQAYLLLKQVIVPSNPKRIPA